MTSSSLFGARVLLLTLFLAGIGAGSGRCQADVQVYAAATAAEVPRSADFTKVEVRPASAGSWSEVAVYDHESTFCGHAGIAAFGLAGPAEVRVTYRQPIATAEILPSRRKIVPHIKGGQVTFTVREPLNLVVNINGDKNHPLTLFANPIDKNPPHPGDPDVDYYAPGTVTRYRNTGKKRIYIAGGAVVKGAITLTSDTVLDGYGMLYTDTNINPLKSWQADRVTVRGIIVYNYGPGLGKQGNWTYLAYQTSHLTVDNVKFFDVFYGEDAIDPDGDCHDLTIKNCFFHVGDDCIAIKASSWQSNGNIPHDIVVTNNVFWQDTYGKPIHIGNETWSTQTLSGLKIVNNDVVRALADTHTFPTDALIGIEAAQGATVAGMQIDGFYIENSDRPRLLDFSVTHHETSKGIGAIRDITIKNVYVTGPWVGSEFAGFDADHRIENLTFEGLYTNGTELTSPEEAKFNLHPFVSHVVVRSGPAGQQVSRMADSPAPDAAHAVRTPPLNLEAADFKTDMATVTRTNEGLELIADSNAPTSGQAFATAPAAGEIVTFKVDVAPSPKFPYPNFAILLGSAEADQFVVGFVDPNTGKAAIRQGGRHSTLKSEEKSGSPFFAKGKREVTLTVDFAGKIVYFAVGDFEMTMPLVEGFKLDHITSIGFDSYRTGATFSNLRFGASGKRAASATGMRRSTGRR